MSRAINIAVDVAALTEICAKHSIAISVIEPLDSGGSRIVLRTMQDADALRAKLKNGQVIDGSVTRSSLYIARQPVPFT